MDQLDVFTVSHNDVAKVPYKILCLFFRGFFFFFFIYKITHYIECICSLSYKKAFAHHLSFLC